MWPPFSRAGVAFCLLDVGEWHMRRLKLLCPALILLAATSLLAQAPVVMVSIDGLRPDYITNAKSCGMEFHTLRAFLTEGSYAEGVVGVLPTVTYPSHTTLVTGVEPARHGILANGTFDPENRNLGGWYWYSDDIKADTLWDAAARKGLITASVGWPVTVGKRNIRYNIPEYWRARNDEDFKLLHALSTPEIFDAMQPAYGAALARYSPVLALDVGLTGAAIWAIQHQAKLVTLHLPALDHEEHEHGPFSAEACSTLAEMDRQVARLEQATFDADANAVVAVVSDHGFSRTSHKLNLGLALLRAGLITPGGATGVAEWKAAVFPAGGLAAIVLHDPGDQVTVDAVRVLLHTLAADPANGIAGILERPEIEKLGGFPNASFVVDLNLDYQLGFAWEGELVTAAPNTGSHGYLPSHPEMRSSLFIRGRGIAHGRNLGVIDIRQIAPTIAQLLGVKLKDAQQPPLNLK